MIIILGNTVPMKNDQMRDIIHNYCSKELNKSVTMKMTVAVPIILKENREGCPQHINGTTSEGLLVQRRGTVMLWISLKIAVTWILWKFSDLNLKQNTAEKTNKYA